MFNREKIGIIYKWWLSIDSTIYMLLGLLIIFGLIFISIASTPVAERLNLNPNYFLKKQIFFSILSIIIITVISIFSTREVWLSSILGLSACFILLLLVLLIGPEIKGAKRWINLFGFTLQPSEIMKPFFLIVNASILSLLNKNNKNKVLLISLGIYVIFSVLLIVQPDIGMFLLLSILYVIQLFLSMLPYMTFAVMGVIGIIIMIITYFTFPHFSIRINSFILSLLMDSDKSYQISKSLEAISSGGILGKGPLEGVVKNSLPDAHTDFIFSALTEEFGFVFSFMIISLFFFIAMRVSIKALDEKNNFCYLSLMGLISYFIIQASINIGVAMNILPTKGMTLPFISYGGSSMLSMSICFGFILVFTKKVYNRQNNIQYFSGVL